jgi:cysteine-rich repeat protein
MACTALVAWFSGDPLGPPSPEAPSYGCGNGARSGEERCDDGNLGASDGCSATCAVETGYRCAGTPSVCFTTCGDGIVAGGEECDDGNISDGDGCGTSCEGELTRE